MYKAGRDTNQKQCGNSSVNANVFPFFHCLFIYLLLIDKFVKDLKFMYRFFPPLDII